MPMGTIVTHGDGVCAGKENGDCPDFRVSENGTVPFDAQVGTVPFTAVDEQTTL